MPHDGFIVWEDWVVPAVTAEPFGLGLSCDWSQRISNARCSAAISAAWTPGGVAASQSLTLVRPPGEGLLGGSALLPLTNEGPRDQCAHGEDRSAGQE